MLVGKKLEKTFSESIYPVDTQSRFSVYKMFYTSYRRLIDVETTSYVYWIAILLFASDLSKLEVEDSEATT